MKKACQSRPDLKVVVTSATLNEEKFSVFFQNCPIINIPGRLFHVDLYHSKVRQVMTASGPSNNSYVDSCVNTVLKIHGSEEKGHILVFLTGSDEIERACSSLRHQLDDRRAEFGGGNEDDLVVVPLYASLSPQEQRKAFISYGHRRKCVIATNIAETSVTVPGIRFVVDPGYVKQKCYDPSRYFSVMWHTTFKLLFDDFVSPLFLPCHKANRIVIGCSYFESVSSTKSWSSWKNRCCDVILFSVLPCS